MRKFVVFAMVICMLFAFGSQVIAAEKFEWRLQSTWAEGFPLLESEKYFVELVEKMSGGRLKIKVYGDGELCPANQVLDLVSNGSVEAGGDWANYWSGKNTAFDLLGSHVAGFGPEDYYTWIYGYGGKKFYDEIYGQFNVVYFPHHSHNMESGIRSTKPIKSLDDFKGMKIRMAGLIQGRLIQAFGAQPVSMALGEVYEALQRGVIDACEMSTPIVDETQKIYEAAKYWLTPGFHQTCSIHGILINKDAWEELPDDLKAIVESAAKASLLTRLSENNAADAKATKTMLEYGVQMTRLSEEEIAIIESEKNKILEDLASKNPDYARVLQNQIDFLKDMSAYRDQLEPWGFGRNWESYPEIDH